MVFLDRYKKILIFVVFVLFLFFVPFSHVQGATQMLGNLMTTDVRNAFLVDYNNRFYTVYNLLYVNRNSSSLVSEANVYSLGITMQNNLFYVDTFNETYNGRSYTCYVIRFYLNYNINYSSTIDTIYYTNISYNNNTDSFQYVNDSGYWVQAHEVTLSNMFVIQPKNLAQAKGEPMLKRYSSASDGKVNGYGFGDKFPIWNVLINYRGDWELFEFISSNFVNFFGGENSSKGIFLLLQQLVPLNKQTSDSTKELTDFVKDDRVDSSSSDFETQSGVDSSNIDSAIGLGLTSIYNKWESGESPDIIFPIPHTENNITLKGDYVSTSLYQNNAGWIVGFIQLAWSFAIYGWVIKDIYHYFDQMKNGDIVNNKDSNIQTTML